MRCPGQDRRYWQKDAVFDVPCPKCGHAVEFFKDESSGRCRDCGHRFKNPKIAAGCAEWCAYAEKCVGFVPQSQLTTPLGEGSLASRLIQAVKEEFEDAPSRLSHALMVFQHAKELVGKEGGDPRVVLAAALLLGIVADEAPETDGADRKQTGQTDGLRKASDILRRVGLDEDTSRRVCQILCGYQTGHNLDMIESKIVWDAERLAALAAASQGKEHDAPANLSTADLRTESARARARSLFPS
jgi:hypothetical protein